MLKDFKRDDALRYMVKHPTEKLFDIYGQPWYYDSERKLIVWTFTIDDDAIETDEDEIDIDEFKIKFSQSAEFSLVVPDEE